MRRAAAGLLVALCCAVAAGCGGGATAEDGAVEIFGPFRGVEADRFIETLEPFTASTGIDVRYVGSGDFVDDLLTRVGEANDPPDVAVVPQLGLVDQLAADGEIVPLSREVDALVDESTAAVVAPLGKVDGTRYAIPFRLSLKSLVWYRPEVFDEHGWTVPRTLGELRRLVDRIQRETDIAPWCLGIESGTATGWPATDWAEDLVLRTQGPEVTRGWAKGEIAFDDPRIAGAFDDFRDLVLEPGRVAGGLTDVVETPVDEALVPLLEDPPACAMSKQPDFAAGWLPDDVEIGEDADVDVFILPGTERATPPILVGGDHVVQFDRDARVEALMQFLAGPEAGESWVRAGGFLSPKEAIDDDAYPEGYRRRLDALLGTVPALVFDPSDQLPPAVGSGLLWREITEWVTGVVDYPEFADRVDRALADEDDGGDAAGG